MNTTSYKNAVHFLHNNLILCNDIAELDDSIFDNARFDFYDEDDNYTEIFQWYLTDCSEDDVKFLEEHFPSLLFSYSERLGLYILCVDHFGTAWSIVPCDTDLIIKD